MPCPPTDAAALYSDHHGWLQRWLTFRLNNACDAADLAHDTFVRVLARPRGIEGGEGGQRAYLTTIARGLLVDHWRRQRLEQAYLEALAARPEAVAPSEESRAIILETLFEIDAMLDRLPPKVSQAFVLAQLEGVGYADIGARLGVSERMVKKYMAQAMLHCIALAASASGAPGAPGAAGAAGTIGVVGAATVPPGH